MLNLYILTYSTLTLFALGLLFVRRRESVLTSARYWQWLFDSWKIITFILATITLSAIAPISGDPTWDIPETILMCGLTYLIGPWAVGVVYRAILGYERDGREIYIAVIFWLFASSWSYDLYVWWWQGMYPLSWFGNLLISPILLLCAGAFWNLEYREGKGVVFAFREREWIGGKNAGFRGLFWYMIPFALLAVAIFGGFLYVSLS